MLGDQQQEIKMNETDPCSQRPPRTRADCINGPRPCPWTTCRHHLESADESCALDVAAREPDGLTLDAIGDILGLTRERVRQIENIALKR